MGRFASSEKQAARAIDAIRDKDPTAIQSLGTARDFQACLKGVCEWMKENKFGSLRDITKDQAIAYLQARAEMVGQKTLDQERQAIQKMQQVLTGKLEPSERLPVVKSELKQVLDSRAYAPEQVHLISEHQTPKNSLATEIAYAAGLRAHELLCLERREDRAPSARPASDLKFSGREPGVIYTVQGKGGLVREVSIPRDLAERLEARRLETPRDIKDRDIWYHSHYDIGGGVAWSKSFSQASTRTLDYSTGAHGLRHSYAQERMQELRAQGHDRWNALEVVSQEMGHFRPEITETYLR